MENVQRSAVRGGAESSALEARNETRNKGSISFLPSPSGDPMPLDADGPTAPRDVLIALTYGLELVRNGAMLVASEGRPHLANRAALAILKKKDGLSLSRTGLIADRAADTRLDRKSTRLNSSHVA